MKLAKCSFCGASPQLYLKHEEIGHNEYILSTYVLCPSCFCRGPVFSDFVFPAVPDADRLASEGWNKIHDRKDASR